MVHKMFNKNSIDSTDNRKTQNCYFCETYTTCTQCNQHETCCDNCAPLQILTYCKNIPYKHSFL